jgi:Myo-inositol oxygenase
MIEPTGKDSAPKTAPARVRPRDSFVRGKVKGAVRGALSNRGYAVRRAVTESGRSEFNIEAGRIVGRHRAQTLSDVETLREKYRAPLYGRITVWDLLGELGQCIDPSDCRLYCTSQQTHVLQVVEGMENDGITDPDLLLAALIHDLGKLLLITDEDPANVVCGNYLIGDYPSGIGLDNCVFQWNHDEFGYSRLKDHVAEHLAWMIRYHSIDLVACDSVLDQRDRDYATRYLRPLMKYDFGTKSPYRLPRRSIGQYRDMIERAFPTPILF